MILIDYAEIISTKLTSFDDFNRDLVKIKLIGLILVPLQQKATTRETTSYLNIFIPTQLLTFLENSYWSLLIDINRKH